MWPGSHDFDAETASAEAAQREAAEAARPETERLAEVEAVAWETTAEMRTRIEWMREEQWRIAQAESAETIADTDAGWSWNPEGILAVTPASTSERYAAMAALQTAGVEVTDETLNHAIVEARWDNVWEVRELTPEEQTEANRQLLASASAEVDIEVETLQSLYEFAHEGTDISEMSPEDLLDFTNEMETVRILTERLDGLEMPTNQAEYEALMGQLEQFRWENGELNIPLTPDELAAMWVTVDAQWNITLSDGTTYSGTDAPPGLPRTSGGNVVSGYRGWANNIPGGPSSRLSDAELAELPGGVDGLMDFISHAEGTADNYNAMFGNGSQSAIDFTSMTISEIYQQQDSMVASNGISSAIGKYQIIQDTLRWYVQSRWMDPNTTRFDEEFQDNFARHKLVERGLNTYLAWWSIDAFQLSLSQEWASLPRDSGGASYYAHDWVNGATVSHQQLRTQIERLREA